MSFCMHNSSFLAFKCISLSTRLNHNFGPRWLRTKKIIQHSYYWDHFERPMWISYNLKMVEFRTNLLPRWEFKVHEVERIQNASKLLWHNAKAIKDHISWLFLDLDVVFMHNSSFLAFQCISLSTRLNHNFDHWWLRTKKIIQDSYY